eukprot:443992-Rhodomonas_salina.2
MLRPIGDATSHKCPALSLSGYHGTRDISARQTERHRHRQTSLILRPLSALGIAFCTRGKVPGTWPLAERTESADNRHRRVTERRHSGKGPPDWLYEHGWSVPERVGAEQERKLHLHLDERREVACRRPKVSVLRGQTASASAEWRRACWDWLEN